MPNKLSSGCPRNIELTNTAATVKAVTDAMRLRSSGVLPEVRVIKIGIAAIGSAITNRAVAISALVFQSCITVTVAGDERLRNGCESLLRSFSEMEIL